jgi:Glycosyltransferase family 87
LRRENGLVDSVLQVGGALWLYAFLVMLVTAASWLNYVHRIQVFSYQGAFDSRPFFTKEQRFNDLTYYIGKTAHLRHGSAALGDAQIPVFNYPPPAAFVYKALLYAFPGHAVRTYLAFLAICILGFAFVVWRAVGGTAIVRIAAAAAILTTAVLGYPLLFTADRGNIEAVSWAVAAAGLCFLLRARYAIAAVLIGLACCIKPFSILFLLLLIGQRKYKEAALAVVTTGLVTLAAVTVLGPNPLTVYRNLKPGVSFYKARYVTNLTWLDEMRFEHSLLDGIKSAALTVEMGGIRPNMAVSEIPRLREQPGGWHRVRRLAQFYPFVAIAAFGLVIAVFYKMPLLNQLTALGVTATLLPPNARDYTLLHLYVPFGALLVFLTREVAEGKATFSKASMFALAVIYALLFAPLTFLRVYAADGKLLLLLALLYVVARSPMHSMYFDDAGRDAANAPMEGQNTEALSH